MSQYSKYSPISGGGGSGTVTSVALSAPSIFSVSGSPVTTTGTLTLSYSGTALPIANGGTNSTATLNNNRLMISSSGAIVESSAITANRALTSNASGIPVASSVTDTELNYVSGVTSAIQTQLNGKANTALSNLASTAVNVDILPGTTNSIQLGSITKRWLSITSSNFNTNDGTNTLIELLTSATSPSVITGPSIRNSTGNSSLAIFTSNNSGATGNVLIETGNVTTGAASSGNISIKTGTISAGTRGNVTIDAQDINLNAANQISANNKKIVNLQNPTSAQDAATKSYVDSASSGAENVEYHSISSGEASAKQFTLAATPLTGSKVLVDIIGGVSQQYSVDFTISGNVFNWSGLGLDGLLTTGDVVRLHYMA